MISIRVDFNRRGREGYVIGSLKRADGLVQPGSVVRVYQPGEPDMDFSAVAVTVAPSGRIELDVDWPAEDVAGARVTVRRSRAASGAPAPAFSFASGAATLSAGSVLSQA